MAEVLSPNNSDSPRILPTNSLASLSLRSFDELAKEEEVMADRLKLSNGASDSEENKNRYGSFAPVRYGCTARWFVDGKDYFEELASYLERAESEIFITDWSLNAELYLRRGPTSTVNDRLDKILERKAKKGVMIYVILWFETELAMKGTVNSGHSVNYLMSLHPNIKVLRHPAGKGKVYWTHHQKTVVIDQQYAYIGGIDLCFGRYDLPEHPLIDDCHLAQHFPGKDYYNPFYQDFSDLEHPHTDLIDRTSHPRMPWHDIHAFVDREAARDIGANFIQRWNHHLFKKLSSGNVNFRGFPKLSVSTTPFLDSMLNKGHACCQIIRSISQWSCGVQTEKSIQAAYLDLIDNAQHYIYIENQYFISVENGLSETIFQRVARAIKFNEKFRVYILLPITPCGDWKLPAIKFVMKWQYDNISRGGTSILERLAASFPNVNLSDYIGFYSLRNAAVLGNTSVTDQIYIHSKLLIVDDRKVIIGSANINDRSMQGDRDSEICILVDDHEFIESKMNGKFFLASKYAATLRMALFSEHLGVEQPIMDPICDETYTLWRKTATENQQLYCSMFPLTPRDYFTTMTQYLELEQAIEKQNPEHRLAHHNKNKELILRLRGHLITYPVDFLKDDKLDSGYVIEKFLPLKVFQ